MELTVKSWIRRFLRNPEEAIACGAAPPSGKAIATICFESVKDARAFLKYLVPRMTSQECSENRAQIELATRMITRADRRNDKRKAKRAGHTVATPPQAPRTRIAGPTAVPMPIAAPKSTVHFEEVTGPDGEVVRFKLEYDTDGKYKSRTRTKQEPPVGSIILDLTSGVKAWKRHGDKRRSHPINEAMLDSYKNSILYKVRQYAMGKVSLKELSEIIKKELLRPAARKSKKKLRRKNRKNA